MGGANIEEMRTTHEQLPAWKRGVTLAFLALFATSGLLGLDTWPATGWRLFSRLRTPDQVSWRIAVESRDGDIIPLPARELPAAYRSAGLVVARVAAGDLGDRRAACGSLGRAGETYLRVPVARVLFIELTRRLWPRSGARAAMPPIERLGYSCRLR